jgi:integrase
MGNSKGTKAGFGSVRKLPSGRFQARYDGPNGRTHNAPITFTSKTDADAWLATMRADIVRDAWLPAPKGKSLTFAEYATGWLDNRTLRPRTISHYRLILDSHLLPIFGPVPLKAITADLVARWHSGMGTRTPTMRAHAYGLLRTILTGAVQDRHIDYNPAHIRGAGNSVRVHKPRPATLDELTALTEAMPERHRLMVVLAAWCALRYGEVTELRRGDIDVRGEVIRVRRAVVQVDGKMTIGLPKSVAGIRDVAIPPHLMPMVRDHLATFISGGWDGLLFPAADGVSNLTPATFHGKKPTQRNPKGYGFYYAREVAGRPDLRFHDLRHTGAVLAASTGATLAELMGRLGHSSPGAAMRYQHAAAGRDRAVAVALSALVAGDK